MKKKLLTSIVASASVGIASLLVATPAIATPDSVPFIGDDIVIGDYTWSLGTNSLEVNDTAYYNATSNVEYGDAWDGSEFAVWDDITGASVGTVTCPSASVAAPDTDGDVVLGCADELLAIGLTASAEIRLYGEGDLARFLVTLSNGTSDAIGYSWQYYVDFGSTDSRATSGTPTLGYTDYVNSDVWSFNDRVSGFDAGVAWGTDGTSGAHDSVNSNRPDELYIKSDAIDGSQNTIAAGDSVTYVFFQKVDASNSINVPTPASVEVDALLPATASSPSTFMAEFSAFNGRLVRGIDPAAIVANWMPASETPAEPEPELAATGVSTQSLTLGAAGALALLLGAALISVRARRARSASAA